MHFVNHGKHWSDKRILRLILKQEKLFWKEDYCHGVVGDQIKRNFVGLCEVVVFDLTGFFRGRPVGCRYILGQGYATESTRCALERAFKKIRIPHL